MGMDIINNIIKTELEFPKIFTHFVFKEYGTLFFNENNKFSYDSNHAILYPDKIDDLDSALDEISKFYLQKGITPRIYHPYINGFLHQNRQFFLKHGYEIEMDDNCQYMLLTDENKISVPERLTIKRIRKWDERIATEIFLPNDNEYTIDVIKESIENDKYYLFVGFLDDVAVTIASLYYSDNGCARLDEVETSINYRNNGYSRELINHLVEYHKENSNNIFYLWAENLIAIKIYTEAGFTLMPTQYESWSAVYNSNNH